MNRLQKDQLTESELALIEGDVIQRVAAYFQHFSSVDLINNPQPDGSVRIILSLGGEASLLNLRRFKELKEFLNAATQFINAVDEPKEEPSE